MKDQFRYYKVELDLTDEQKITVDRNIGTARYIYNFFIAKNKEIYEETGKFMGAYDFQKWLNNVFIPNNKEYSWIKDVSSKNVKRGIINAETAFKRFFKHQSKFPRFKKKKKQNASMYLINQYVAIERHRIKLPILSWVKLKEFGYIPNDAVVKSETISKKADRYYLSVLCVQQVSDVKENITQSEPIGIDLGIKELAVVSNGEVFGNINKSKKIKKEEKKLKRVQRALSRKFEVAKKNKGGTDRKRTNINRDVLKLQKLHISLSNKRMEYIRFVVNSLVRTKPEYIAIEDLNVVGMMRNRHLSKAIQKQMWGYFRSYLTDQCRKLNIELRVVPRFFASSKICSCCGTIKVDLKLSDRTYKCICGNIMDRDLNASYNIRDSIKYAVA